MFHGAFPMLLGSGFILFILYAMVNDMRNDRD